MSVGRKGWSPEGKQPDLREPPRDPTGWISRIFGQFVTGMTVSLEAPLWFDILTSLNSMRTTGKLRQKAEDQVAATP
ncbi:MAG: hypothetical protein EXR98_05330 [Gemmataceae bacterium]|nr:hypothetical protein [Gemmataceae bacterium]